MVLICSDKTSRFHAAVLQTRIWGVSILAEEGIEASAWLAKRGRPLDHQLANLGHHRGESGVALLDASLAWLECSTTAIHDGGDHSIIVGAVTAAGIREDLDEPLLYYRSHYGTLIRSAVNEKSLIKVEKQ